MPPSQISSEVVRLIEQGRVDCLCGRTATGTTSGGEPECDDPSCRAAEEVERLRQLGAGGAEDTIRRAYRVLTNIDTGAATAPARTESSARWINEARELLRAAVESYG